MKVAFHTLGCKVNQYETEAIKEAFVSRGAQIVSEDEPADVYVVNTCTVTNIADRKSRQYIRRMKSIAPESVMVVTGCYAQVAEEEIKKMPEVDMIIGNNLKSQIADLVYDYTEKIQISPEDATVIGAIKLLWKTRNLFPEVHTLGYDELREYEDMGTVTLAESSMCRAYIKIEEGCNRFCSYCLIPYARGRVRSRRPDEVVEEARSLIAKGYKEIILTGINTALYGTEAGFEFEREAEEEGLSGLEIIIKRIDALEGDFRIRLSSLEPTVVNVEEVKKLLGYKKLCHHLHLSLQSGSNDVLKTMNRRYNREEYLEIVKALRDFDPLYGITTDIIVGFPGEKDRDFEDSLDVVRKAEFARVHAFRYSPRKGTKAAALKNTVQGSVSSLRASRLEEAAKETARRFNERNFDVVHTVLAEEEQDGYITGYTENYIKVYIELPKEGADKNRPRPGEFCRVKLTENYNDGCKAVIAD